MNECSECGDYVGSLDKTICFQCENLEENNLFKHSPIAVFNNVQDVNENIQLILSWGFIPVLNMVWSFGSWEYTLKYLIVGGLK